MSPAAAIYLSVKCGPLFALLLWPIWAAANPADIFGLFAPILPNSAGGANGNFFGAAPAPQQPQSWWSEGPAQRRRPFEPAQTSRPANEGVKIVSYAFQNCTSALWTPHYFWVEHFDFYPKVPTFPGSMFINLTVWVNRDLPDDIDAVFNISAARFTRNPFENPFEQVACYGYDAATGCDGVGSCRYCDIINSYCTKHLPQGDCPPRRGRYSVTFNQRVDLSDMPESFVGKLRTTKYWITVKLEQRSTRQEIACGRVILDVCKFSVWDRSQTCTH